ncbi:pyridoxal phosphate-dependent aminotransferase [Mangrovibacillus cuniculi]|uniref:Pyridoxal phosphate-dependent aminotransferase n=1 Tax=Mangrovibacillus cuniculi TaxID=2593652 RepID=A0A7S8C9Z5_9BACI|nr:pyridoxal phosphate-dependent aminotransferase [Mangrovibacillus cuniculi]QPC46135.1 pyridoxal phosphate-dependent aminotransferase [Mangrovibacillus cuniculi]
MTTFPHAERLRTLPTQFFASLVKQVNELAAQGHDLINLGQGNPDLPTPTHIVDSLKKASENPINHKYPPFRGIKEFKKACATFYEREYGVKVDSEKEIAILFGGKAGLVELPLCLTEPGDGILVPDPGYPDYWSGVSLANAEMIPMPLIEENNFLPNYDSISVSDLERSKLLFINYPNNPTGATATKEFFDETVALAKKHKIAVIHDFAYGAIGFEGKKPKSFLSVDGAKEVGVEVYTLSKTYNMAGWRVGFMIGNPSIIEAVELLQDHLYVSLFGAVQEAAITALLEDQSCVTELVDTYESRRNVLVGGLNEIGWEVEAPAGSFFAWLKVPDNFTSVEFSQKLLREAHVVVAPGIGFGEYGEGYVRVGLLANEDRLREAVERIKRLDIF